MIVDAIQEKFPKYSHVTADLQTIRFSDKAKGLRYIYITPRLCVIALINFDRGKRTRPFKFTLRGAHTVAMVLSNRQIGAPIETRTRARAHRLGQQRIVQGSSRGRNRAPRLEMIGGRAPPRPVSASTKRVFGMRALTEDDLGCLGLPAE
jgi:hypothetical protein